MRKLRHFLYFILLIALDQFTKHLAAANLKENPFIIIPKVFQFTYHENNGAVWGILSGKIIFLILVTFLLLFLMVILYLKIPKDKRYNAIRIILVFICAGAVGNLIDRVFNGYVVDYIYFELIDFPVFNLADCYVTMSSILLIILGLFYYKDEDFEFLSSKSVKTVTTDGSDWTEEKAVMNGSGETEEKAAINGGGETEEKDIMNGSDETKKNAAMNGNDVTEDNDGTGDKNAASSNEGADEREDKDN